MLLPKRNRSYCEREAKTHSKGKGWKPKIKDECLTSSSLSPGTGVELFRAFISVSRGLFRPSRGETLSTTSIALPWWKKVLI